MVSFELVEIEPNITINNVKINKIIFVERHTPKEWLHLVEECHQNNQEDRKKFICVYCNCKKNFKMRLNEHKKKGCEKTMDDDGNQLTLKLYLPLKNTIEGVIFAKRGMFWNTRQSWNHCQNQGATISLLQRQFHSHSKRRKRRITIF